MHHIHWSHLRRQNQPLFSKFSFSEWPCHNRVWRNKNEFPKTIYCQLKNRWQPIVSGVLQNRISVAFHIRPGESLDADTSLYGQPKIENNFRKLETQLSLKCLLLSRYYLHSKIQDLKLIPAGRSFTFGDVMHLCAPKIIYEPNSHFLFFIPGSSYKRCLL